MHPRLAPRFLLLAALLLLVAAPAASAASKGAFDLEGLADAREGGLKAHDQGQELQLVAHPQHHLLPRRRRDHGLREAQQGQPHQARHQGAELRGQAAQAQQRQGPLHAAQDPRAHHQVQQVHRDAPVAGRDRHRRAEPGALERRRPSGGSTGGSGQSVTAGCSTTDPSGDADGDLLSNATEKSIGTDPCNYDTDGDGVSDGYEYKSALDLGHYPGTAPTPYPGKRPYPNALDPSDSGTDYDGDGLKLREEYLIWFRYSADGVPARRQSPTTLNNLLYSDGLQRSVNPPPPRRPATHSPTGTASSATTACSMTTSATRTATASATGTRPTAAWSRPGGRRSTTARTSPRSPRTPGSTSSTTPTPPGRCDAPTRTSTATASATAPTTRTTTGSATSSSCGARPTGRTRPTPASRARPTELLGVRQPVQPLQAVHLGALPTSTRPSATTAADEGRRSARRPRPATRTATRHAERLSRRTRGGAPRPG